jgi:hypothetical protein
MLAAREKKRRWIASEMPADGNRCPLHHEGFGMSRFKGNL